MATFPKTTEELMSSGGTSPTLVQSGAKHHYLPDMEDEDPIPNTTRFNLTDSAAAALIPDKTQGHRF